MTTKFKKGQYPWNKGLTKETDERIKRYSEKESRLRKGKHYSPKTEIKKGQTGKDSPAWKGGKFKAHDRWLVRKPDHPFSHKDGYVLHSRLIAEKCLGRYLTRQEVIHHINCNPSDDRPENLYLFPSKATHTSYEGLKNKPILNSNLL